MTHFTKSDNIRNFLTASTYKLLLITRILSKAVFKLLKVGNCETQFWSSHRYLSLSIYIYSIYIFLYWLFLCRVYITYGHKLNNILWKSLNKWTFFFLYMYFYFILRILCMCMCVCMKEGERIFIDTCTSLDK